VLGHSQWKFYEGFYDINYSIISYLMMIYHYIYEERNKISFIGMKLV
jgi:hypothetical protein